MRVLAFLSYFSITAAGVCEYTLRGLKQRVGDSVPIIGVAISPFSLPVMQMGFDRYIELIYEQPGRFERLMQANIEFCVNWSNAQLAAGATAICYFDPVSSTTSIPRAPFSSARTPMTPPPSVTWSPRTTSATAAI